MNINDLIRQKSLTKYRLSAKSGVPYATVNDICNGKARIEKCSADTLYKLATALDTTIESLIIDHVRPKRSSFEVFKGNVCHHLKAVGDIKFIVETLESGEIRRFYNMRWYPESMYLLAMVDYLSRLHSLPVCREFNDIRKQRLSEPLYPMSVRIAEAVTKDTSWKERCVHDAIPEFLRFNIVESEVRNVF